MLSVFKIMWYKEQYIRVYLNNLSTGDLITIDISDPKWQRPFDLFLSSNHWGCTKVCSWFLFFMYLYLDIFFILRSYADNSMFSLSAWKVWYLSFLYSFVFLSHIYVVFFSNCTNCICILYCSYHPCTTADCRDEW